MHKSNKISGSYGQTRVKNCEWTTRPKIALSEAAQALQDNWKIVSTGNFLEPLVQQEIENLVAPMQQVLCNLNTKDESSATVGCISCELDAPIRSLFCILDATKGHASLNYKSRAVCVQIS